MATSTTELPISINDIEDLLQNVPTTTRRAKPTTARTKPTTPSASDNDDLNFLRQVVSEAKMFAFVCINTHRTVTTDGLWLINTRNMRMVCLFRFVLFRFVFLCHLYGTLYSNVFCNGQHQLEVQFKRNQRQQLRLQVLLAHRNLKFTQHQKARTNWMGPHQLSMIYWTASKKKQPQHGDLNWQRSRMQMILHF